MTRDWAYISFARSSNIVLILVFYYLQSGRLFQIFVWEKTSPIYPFLNVTYREPISVPPPYELCFPLHMWCPMTHDRSLCTFLTLHPYWYSLRPFSTLWLRANAFLSPWDLVHSWSSLLDRSSHSTRLRKNLSDTGTKSLLSISLRGNVLRDASGFSWQVFLATLRACSRLIRAKCFEGS